MGMSESMRLITSYSPIVNINPARSNEKCLDSPESSNCTSMVRLSSSILTTSPLPNNLCDTRVPTIMFSAISALSIIRSEACMNDCAVRSNSLVRQPSRTSSFSFISNIKREGYFAVDDSKLNPSDSVRCNSFSARV